MYVFDNLSVRFIYSEVLGLFNTQFITMFILLFSWLSTCVRIAEKVMLKSRCFYAMVATILTIHFVWCPLWLKFPKVSFLLDWSSWKSFRSVIPCSGDNILCKNLKKSKTSTQCWKFILLMFLILNNNFMFFVQLLTKYFQPGFLFFFLLPSEKNSNLRKIWNKILKIKR